MTPAFSIAARPPRRPPARYRTALATTSSAVDAAGRLRREVVAGTGGAGDGWDGHCDHVVVHDEAGGRVVGTCRLLSPGRAAALGRSYGDGAFDLSRHTALRPGLVEFGRGWVHPDHRTGAVVPRLWAGVARYVLDGGHSHLAGCVSVPLTDGGATAAGLWDLLVRERRLAPAGLWVLPRVPFDVQHAPAHPGRLVLPPLWRAWLRIGGRVCGRPGYDAAFGTAEFYLLLAASDLDPRMVQRLRRVR